MLHAFYSDLYDYPVVGYEGENELVAPLLAYYAFPMTIRCVCARERALVHLSDATDKDPQPAFRLITVEINSFVMIF